MIYLVSGLFFLFSPLVCMLHCSDDLLSIWIVLLVLSPSLFTVCCTVVMICLVSGLFFLFSPLVCMLHCSDDLLSIWIVLLVLSPSLYVAL